MLGSHEAADDWFVVHHGVQPPSAVGCLEDPPNLASADGTVLDARHQRRQTQGDRLLADLAPGTPGVQSVLGLHDGVAALQQIIERHLPEAGLGLLSELASGRQVVDGWLQRAPGLQVGLACRCHGASLLQQGIALSDQAIQRRLDRGNVFRRRGQVGDGGGHRGLELQGLLQFVQPGLEAAPQAGGRRSQVIKTGQVALDGAAPLQALQISGQRGTARTAGHLPVLASQGARITRSVDSCLEGHRSPQAVAAGGQPGPQPVRGSPGVRQRSDLRVQRLQ